MSRQKGNPMTRRDFVVRARFRTADKARIEAVFRASGQPTMSDWLRDLVRDAFKRFEEQKPDKEPDPGY